VARPHPEAQVAATASASPAPPAGAALPDGDLPDAVLPDATLRDAVLRDAVLPGAVPPGSVLADAVPTGTGLPQTDLSTATAGALLTRYLTTHAGAFLRALRARNEGAVAAEAEALPLLLGAARRIAAALHTYRTLTEPRWAAELRGELAWLVAAVTREHTYAARLERLLTALQRLSGGSDAELPVAGAARAGALLDRQLTLARTRSHSAALQALGSSRFHAVADAVALLASDVPLDPVAARAPAAEVLLPLAEAAQARLAAAATELPLGRAATAYNGEALVAALHQVPAQPAAPAEPADAEQDAPWHRVHDLARDCRYALEACAGPGEDQRTERLRRAGLVLELHRDAAEAAAAAASAARTPRIAPATAYALGVLHADQRREVEAARYTFSRLWHRPAPAG
jgi:CHAD domain